MTPELDWQGLRGCSATPFPPGWDQTQYVFFSPRDRGVHSAILQVIESAGHSVLVNMYGYDDPEIDSALHAKAADPEIAFFMNLDSSQAGGQHEKALLQPWAGAIGTSVAVGRSAKKAISHLKLCVVDSLYVLSGSTNWSLSGEESQDNELRVSRDPLLAGRYSSVILLNHSEMLKQMAVQQKGGGT